MRANAPEWEPGRRDTLETLPSDFVPPFPASGRRNVGALPRNVSSRHTEVWGDAVELNRSALRHESAEAQLLRSQELRMLLGARCDSRLAGMFRPDQ
jgi:hypothetical protein